MGAVSEKLRFYNSIVGTKGERLADLFRFQAPPNDKYPRIYLPFDSLLNHKSRLVRSARMWLGDTLSENYLYELQMILVGHDVLELRDGDESRLNQSATEDRTDGLDEWLLPDDISRYQDFVRASNYLEKGAVDLPRNCLSLVARWMDTADGNIIAYALMENYAVKIGGGVFDNGLQAQLDRSIAHVNKLRGRYRERLAMIGQNTYSIDLVGVLQRILDAEAEKLYPRMESIRAQRYQTGELI